MNGKAGIGGAAGVKKSVIAGISAAAAVTLGSTVLIIAQKDAVNATEAGKTQNETTVENTAEAQEQEKESAIPDIQVSPGIKVAVVSKCVKGEFISLVTKGMEQAVSDVNTALGYSGGDKISITVEGPKDELDIETQINTLDAVISENPDVLCMSIGDRSSCLAQLEAAKENGIPVVIFDASSDYMELTAGYRASDNLNIGRIGAEKLCEAIQGSGKVAIIAGQERTSTTEDRVKGFNEKLKDYPGVQVAEIIYEDQVEDIRAAVAELLAAHPDLAGVFCTRAEEADLYLSIEKGENSPAMVGVDGTKAQQEAIRKGIEYGCVSQDAWQIGYDTMILALSAVEEDASEVEEVRLLEPGWLDASNIDLEENKKYLF